MPTFGALGFGSPTAKDAIGAETAGAATVALTTFQTLAPLAFLVQTSVLPETFTLDEVFWVAQVAPTLALGAAAFADWAAKGAIRDAASKAVAANADKRFTGSPKPKVSG